MKWLSRFRRWQQKQIRGSISISSDGLSLEKNELSALMRWNEIEKIEVERFPTFTADTFFVILSDEKGQVLELDDEMDGFDAVSDVIFERWPEVEREWVAVFCGPPQTRERVTLWVAPRNRY